MGLCLFLGDNISHVDVKLISSSGVGRSVQKTTHGMRPFVGHGRFRTHYGIVQWIVPAVNETSNFRCSASDEARGTEASEIVTVH
ncbi:hypothetical protein PoB_004034800 [Plakobranchus ocellatus]|uniref:Uncharacterized protein n=1 Tax=Plakobranchus ocellatus TaxID=259542 RepID=A0AAV4B4Z9_9GAST|nr:hypothetical protein PoB_004034800 [Plakobranchus ocellatus]